MKPYTLLFIKLLISTTIFPQAGTLDVTFGDGGRVISPGFGECKASGIQSTGKIILAGEYDNSHGNFNSVARYNTDGSLDASFGNNGWIVPDSRQLVGITCMAILHDDKFIAVGYSGGPNLVKYNADGEPDSSFGENGDGVVITDLYDQYHYMFITAVGLQADGKIVIAGRDSAYLAIVIRYTADGRLDESFGNSGVSEVNLGGGDFINALAIQPDGKIVIGGADGAGSGLDFLLARLNTDGTKDLSFGVEGRVKTFLSNDKDVITSLALLSDTKILAQGTLGFDEAQVVVRYKPNGKVDSSFGINGVAEKAFEGSYLTFAHSMAIQEDGKIVVGGTLIALPKRYFTATRFTANGVVDSSFGESGTAITEMYDNAQSTSISLQPDGKIILAGNNESLADKKTNFAMVRYNNDRILPLHFSYFNAAPTSNGVALNWQTAQENNNNYFSVEHSANNNFNELARVNSQGNSSQAQTYSYTDNTPLQGTNFYRLKQVDKDGKFSYSQIVSATMQNGLTVVLYPNPVRDILNIKGLELSTNYDLRITNARGSVIAQASVNNSSSYKWNLRSLSKGVYYLSVVSENKKITVKFVKE